MRQQLKTDIAVAEIRKTMGSADEHRSNTLSADLEEEQDRIEALKYERQRLVSKFGENSPRVAAVDTEIETRGNLMSALRVERQRAAMPVPKTSPREAALYGRVTQNDGMGLAKVDVTVRPAGGDSKQPAAIFDHGKSGQPGKPAAPGASNDKTRKAVTDAEGRFEVRLPATEPVAVIVELSYEGRLLYRSDEPIPLAPGAATYREIAVDVPASKEAKPERPRPESTRKRAVPKPKSR
jgi:hypothetical protein